MPVVDKTRSSLGFVTKLAYGAGTMGISATGIMLASYLMVFLTDVAGLPAALASWALVIGQFSDAISDPIVGMLSDRTRTRWGRRYPWIVVGAIPFGLSFFLLWLIPVQGNDWLLFTYYVVVGIIYKTCYTAVYLPYVSLTPELSQGYNERTNLNSFRFAFAIGSNIFAIFVSGIALSQIESPPHKYLAIGALGAFLCIIPLYLCVLGTHRHVIPNEQRRAHVTAKTSSLPLRQQLRIAFSNRPFLLVVGIYLCSWLAAQITMVVMVYFVLYWIQSTYEVFTLFALFVLGTAFLMLFVWSEVSRKVGKKAVYCMGIGIWIIAQISLFNLAPGQVPQLYGLGVMAGIGLSTAYLVPWSMLPDVIELDELKTGQRREGVFYAFMVMVQKLGLAGGLFLVGQALDKAGYISQAADQAQLSADNAQPASALLAIRLAIGPIPTLFLVGGLILAYFYPISPTVHAEIMAKLSQQRRALEEENSD